MRHHLDRYAGDDRAYHYGRQWAYDNDWAHDLATKAYPEVRIVLCDVCGSEGRLYTSNGGPDETDRGPCPWCDDTGGALIPVEPIDFEDLELAA